MHFSNAASFIALMLLSTLSAAAHGQGQPFVHGSDIQFRIRIDRKTYKIGDKIAIRYSIKNVSNGPLYVPARQWGIKCGDNPHLWSLIEDSSGKHYEPGFGGSCLFPNQIDSMSVSERMRSDALLLKPGHVVAGSFSFDSSVFAANLMPGRYRLEAFLYGWNQRFDDSQLSELLKMGSPFLVGESAASLPFELRAAQRYQDQKGKLH